MNSEKDTYFRHPAALVETNDIGQGTRIWAFAHVLSGAVVGRDCNICDHVFIESGVTVGDRVTVKCGVQLWTGVHLGDDVFVGPNATFTNDPFPRSNDHGRPLSTTVVERGASIGANATVLPGVRVGPNSMVGAGAVVTTDVPANAIVMGNPARITGYVPTVSSEPVSDTTVPSQPPNALLGRRGVRVLATPQFNDLRGLARCARGCRPPLRAPTHVHRVRRSIERRPRRTRPPRRASSCSHVCMAVFECCGTTGPSAARCSSTAPRKAFTFPQGCGDRNTASPKMQCWSCWHRCRTTPTITCERTPSSSLLSER